MGNKWQEFTKEVAGNDENAAREEVYSRLGSKHRVKRSKIQVSEVKEISPQDVSDPITVYLLKSGEDNKMKRKIKVRKTIKRERQKGEKNG